MQNRCKKWKTKDLIEDLKLNISVITLNLNGLHTPSKRDCQSDFYKGVSSVCCLHEFTSNTMANIGWVKWWKSIHHAGINQENVGMTISIPYK